MAGVLEALSGSAFDSEYIAIQLAEHSMALALFSREARVGRDAGLRAFAERTIPVLHRHLDMAEALAAARISSLH